MKPTSIILVMATALASATAAPALAMSTIQSSQTGVRAAFADAEGMMFTAEQQGRIETILADAHAEVRRYFPQLTGELTVTFTPVDWPLDGVGGVTGRADAPGDIQIQIATGYPGGVDAAIEDGLRDALYHEMHHLVRGWTINENAFGPGIHIAAANEGLAVVFAETLTGEIHDGNRAPENAEAWALEIRDLPLRSDYYQWMFEHPDGRTAVGYRSGSYLVRRAMEESGLSIVELTDRTPDEIWILSGLGARPASLDQ